MYYHSKSGYIFPLPLYLLWKFKKYFFAFGLAFNLLAPTIWLLMPKAPIQTEAQKSKALSEWRPPSCAAPIGQKNIEFCKNFKGF